MSAGRHFKVGLLLLASLWGVSGAAWLLILGPESSSEAGLGRVSTDGANGSSERTSAVPSWGTAAGRLIRLPLFRTQPDNVPSVVRRTVRMPGWKVIWRLAQRLPRVRGRTTIWAVPTSRGLCLVSSKEERAFGTTCSPQGAVLREGLAITFLDDASTPARHRHRVIVGVVPADVSHVDIYTGQVRTSARVADGHFVRQDKVTEPPDRIALR